MADSARITVQDFCIDRREPIRNGHNESGAPSALCHYATNSSQTVLQLVKLSVTILADSVAESIKLARDLVVGLLVHGGVGVDDRL